MSIETMDTALYILTSLILICFALVVADYVSDYLKDQEEKHK